MQSSDQSRTQVVSWKVSQIMLQVVSRAGSLTGALAGNFANKLARSLVGSRGGIDHASKAESYIRASHRYDQNPGLASTSASSYVRIDAA